MPGAPPQPPGPPQAAPQPPREESAQQVQPSPSFQPQPYPPQPYPPQPYPPQAYQPPFPYPPPAYQPQPYPDYGYSAPVPPIAAAAALDPVAAQQLAALQHAVQTLQGAPTQPAEPETHPTGPDVAPNTRLSPSPVSRVGRTDTYTTKGHGSHYSTRG